MHFYYLGKKNAIEPFLSSCNEVSGFFFFFIVVYVFLI